MITPSDFNSSSDIAGTIEEVTFKKNKIFSKHAEHKPPKRGIVDEKGIGGKKLLHLCIVGTVTQVQARLHKGLRLILTVNHS